MSPRIILTTLSLLSSCLMAGESILTTTYQPLDGLGITEIVIAPVVCHDWYSRRDVRGIDLISAKNVPPTNSPTHATADLNLASLCSISFSTNDTGAADPAPLEITMDLSEFVKPKNISQEKEDIVRASLECLRLCIPDKSKKVPVILICKEADKSWLTPIVDVFNQHDLKKVFFVSK